MADRMQTTQLRVAAPKASTGISRPRLKRAALALGVIAVVFGVADYGRYYWTTGRYLVSTDDAYVDVHSALISPKISGYIPVNDNQTVEAGQTIARIDPRDYQTALDQARADVAAAQATIETLTQQIAQQRLVVEQARQQVASDQAALAANAAAQTPSWPITNGRHLQPTQQQIDSRENNAARQRDRAAQSQVDRLFDELTRDSAPGKR